MNIRGGQPSNVPRPLLRNHFAAVFGVGGLVSAIAFSFCCRIAFESHREKLLYTASLCFLASFTGCALLSTQEGSAAVGLLQSCLLASVLLAVSVVWPVTWSQLPLLGCWVFAVLATPFVYHFATVQHANSSSGGEQPQQLTISAGEGMSAAAAVVRSVDLAPTIIDRSDAHVRGQRPLMALEGMLSASSLPSELCHDAAPPTQTSLSNSAARTRSLTSSAAQLHDLLQPLQPAAEDSLQPLPLMLSRPSQVRLSTYAGGFAIIDSAQEHDAEGLTQAARDSLDAKTSAVRALARCKAVYARRGARQTMRFKIDSFEPAHLPEDFLESMSSSLAALGHQLVGSAVRQGCVELVVDLVYLDGPGVDDMLGEMLHEEGHAEHAALADGVGSLVDDGTAVGGDSKNRAPMPAKSMSPPPPLPTPALDLEATRAQLPVVLLQSLRLPWEARSQVAVNMDGVDSTLISSGCHNNCGNGSWAVTSAKPSGGTAGDASTLAGTISTPSRCGALQLLERLGCMPPLVVQRPMGGDLASDPDGLNGLAAPLHVHLRHDMSVRPTSPRPEMVIGATAQEPKAWVARHSGGFLPTAELRFPGAGAAAPPLSNEAASDTIAPSANPPLVGPTAADIRDGEQLIEVRDFPPSGHLLTLELLKAPGGRLAGSGCSMLVLSDAAIAAEVASLEADLAIAVANADEGSAQAVLDLVADLGDALDICTELAAAASASHSASGVGGDMSGAASTYGGVGSNNGNRRAAERWRRSVSGAGSSARSSVHTYGGSASCASLDSSITSSSMTLPGSMAGASALRTDSNSTVTGETLAKDELRPSTRMHRAVIDSITMQVLHLLAYTVGCGWVHMATKLAASLVSLLEAEFAAAAAAKGSVAMSDEAGRTLDMMTAANGSTIASTSTPFRHSSIHPAVPPGSSPSAPRQPDCLLQPSQEVRAYMVTAVANANAAAAMDEDALTLLQRAVLSGNLDMVLATVSWGSTFNISEWDSWAAAVGPAKLSAVHLLAGAEDGGALAMKLLALPEVARELASVWFTQKDAFSQTPAQVAVGSNNGYLSTLLQRSMPDLAAQRSRAGTAPSNVVAAGATHVAHARPPLDLRATLVRMQLPLACITVLLAVLLASLQGPRQHVIPALLWTTSYLMVCTFLLLYYPYPQVARRPMGAFGRGGWARQG